jgi:hypothetical protein
LEKAGNRVVDMLPRCAIIKIKEGEMKLKILAAGLLTSSLLTLSTGCEIFCHWCPILPGDGSQPGQVLFFDDFEDGADPAWSAASGKWVVKSGRFGVEQGCRLPGSGWLNAYIKTPNSPFWKDYAVEVDVFNPTKARWGAIIVRAQDDLNKVVFMWRTNFNSLVFHVYVNGELGNVRAFTTPTLTADRARIRVEVIGSTYAAYIREGEQGDPIERLVFTDTDHTYLRGMPGIGLYGEDYYCNYDPGEVTFDNFKVTSLGQ